MPDSDGRERAAFRRIITQCLTALIVMVAVGWISFLWEHTQAVRIRREVAQRESAAYCEQRNHEPCQATKYAAMQARAEEDAVDASVWQIWLNVGGLLGLGATVVYARRAWREAQRSADSAQRTLEHGRAYIVAEVRDPIGFAVGGDFKGAVSIQNVGRTPAYNVSTLLSVAVIPLGGSSEIPDADEVPRVHLVVGPTHAKLVSKTRGAVLTQQEFDDLTASRSLLIVGGCVVYDDVFGRTWWTQFCHVHHGAEMKGSYHTELNRAT